jgi:hypothetical protein
VSEPRAEILNEVKDLEVKDLLDAGPAIFPRDRSQRFVNFNLRQSINLALNTLFPSDAPNHH